jgi:PAS domain S-box-containing protein
MSGQKTVLLVEDDAMIATIERMNLERYGYVVFTAKDGEDAVGKFRARPEIDLVLMDLNLGAGMDGTEAAAMILAEKDLPVVFLSSHTEPEIVAKTESITSYGYVVKNSGITILDAAIKMAFRLFDERQKVRESEERYRRLVEISPDAIFINQGGKIVFANRACAELLGGGDAAKVLGKSPFDFIHSDYHETVRGRIGRIMEEESQAPYQDMLMVRHDGSAVEVETTAISFETGAAPAIQVIVRDISARKRAQRSLRESEERLRLFIEHAPAALAMFDRDMRYVAVSDRWLAVYGMEGRSLIGKSHYEVFPDVPESWKEIHRRGMRGELIRAEEDRFARGDGSVQWLRWEVRPWRDVDDAVGGILIFFEDITERKRMEEELRRTEALFRGMFEQAAVGMAQIDSRSGDFLRINRKFCDIVGYSSEDMAATTFQAITHPDDLQEDLNNMKRLLAGEFRSFSQEKRYIRKDGGIVWVNLAVSALWDPGERPEYHLAIVEDITARKEAEAALAESEAGLAEAQRAAKLGNWSFTIATEEVRWSEELYRIFGATRDGEALSHDYFLSFVLPDDRERVMETNRVARESGEPFEVDYRIATSDGTEKHIHEAGYARKNGEGRVVGLFGLAQDVTERRRLEGERSAVLGKYKTLFDSFPLGITVADREGKIVESNAMAVRLLGLDDNEHAQRSIDGGEWRMVRPDGTDMPQEEYASVRALKEGVPVQNVEMGLSGPRGVGVWLNVTAAPLANGGVVITYGDITEKKRAERELRESEKRFSRVFHSSPACQLITTYPGGKILDVNEAYCRLLGRSREEFLGRTTAELGIWRSPEDRAAAFKGFAADGRIVQREVVFRRGSGELITVLASVEPIELRGEACVVSTVVDITERRRAASALLQSEERYRRLVEISPDAVFINKDDSIVYANPAMARLLGAGDPARIIGMKPLEIFHPDSHELVKERIKALRSGDGAVPAVTEQVVRLDGTTVMVETSAIPFDLEGGSAIQVIMRDISERLAAEAALADSAERYRGIFDGASQGIIAADLVTGCFSVVNPAMCRMFGYDADEFRGLSVCDLHPPEAEESARGNFDRMAGGTLSFVPEFPCIRKEGVRFFADIAVSLVNFGGRRHLLGFFTEATERVKGQKLLRESEERYRSLIENSHDLIQSADANGSFIFVNDAWLRTMEYTREDLKNIRLSDVVHADSRAECEMEFRQVLEGKAVERISPVFVTRTGRTLDLEGNVVPHVRADGTVITNAFFNEITERKREEIIKSIRLAASQAIYRPAELDEILFELCRALGLTSSLDFGEVWWLNRDARRMERRQYWVGEGDGVGLARDFLVASEGMTFSMGEGMPGRVWAEGRTTIFVDLPNHPDFLRREIAGQLGVTSVAGIPIGDKGNVRGAILLFGTKCHVPALFLQDIFDEIGRQTGDIVARKTLETELELERRDLARRVDERTAELRRATAAAEAASRAKSDFLASMSHELRTPLNSVIGFSEVMMGGLTGALTPEQEEYLGDIHASGKLLLSLINDILDLSKVEAGKMELQTGPVSVGELARMTMALFKEKTLKHGIAFRSDILLEEAYDLLNADERKLKQVLFNLVSNAVKFTPDGGTVVLGVRRIQDGDRPFVEFRVSDTGIGIAPEDRKRLFLPFSQLDGSSTRNYGGTGLGLSICKSFVELHGGKIWLESEVGKGSTFYFRVPAESSGIGEG